MCNKRCGNCQSFFRNNAIQSCFGACGAIIINGDSLMLKRVNDHCTHPDLFTEKTETVYEHFLGSVEKAARTNPISGVLAQSKMAWKERESDALFGFETDLEETTAFLESQYIPTNND